MIFLYEFVQKNTIFKGQAGIGDTGVTFSGAL
jgi:hypothetical protein